MRAALMHHSGGLPGSFLQGVNLPCSNSVTLPSRRTARRAAMRVSSLETTLRLCTKASRKSLDVDELVGAHDVAVRLLQLRVALGRQRVGALVVDDLIGRQDVVVEVDLDVAAGDDTVVLLS